MDNNKLGLKIVRINQGYTDLLEINGDQNWTRNVWDIRKGLEKIDNLDGSSAVLMLTSVDTGHILTVASLIEGRITDCISAWVYVPATINITGRELVEIVDIVKKEILANERNDERLIQLFSRSYEAAPATRITVKGNGDRCAYRYYGQGAKYTLSELLKDMCQSYYKNYKSVFLLDNSSRLRCLEGDDLSSQKVCSMIVVKSPGNTDSFVPYVGGKVFNGQMYAVEGDVIKIEWRRNGYLPIQTETTVCQDMRYSVPTPDQYMRVIPYDTIRVVDEWGQSFREYVVYVENELIENGRAIAISESKINNVRVRVYAEGYKPICENVNLTQTVRLKLSKETYAYEFMLPLKYNLGDYKIEISGKRKIEDSPVYGYVLDYEKGNKKYLKQEPKFDNKFWITYIIGSLILILAGFFIAKVSLTDEYEMIKAQLENDKRKLEKEIESLKEPKKTKHTDSIKDAISYLDENDVWDRTEMEKFDVLKGLWDAMNEYRFDEIKKYKEKLKDSKKFLQVLEAVNDNNDKVPEKGKKYCKDGDTKITINKNGYIDVLKKLNKNQVSSSKQKRRNSSANGTESIRGTTHDEGTTLRQEDLGLEK